MLFSATRGSVLRQWSSGIYLLKLQGRLITSRS
jgi:hypothetical protein